MDDALTRLLPLGPHLVPGLWRFMFPSSVEDLKFPSECQSTCSNCPKISEEGFRPDYRCCTYQPRIPNFLIGLALEDPETAPMIEDVIAKGFATPEGLLPTTAETRRALTSRVGEGFGKTDAVVCRFLDLQAGTCRMYKYRNSVCSSFFCKHDQADAGQEFWSALQAAGSQTEAALAQWAMQTVGIDVAAYFDRFDGLAQDLDNVTENDSAAWSQATRRVLWGEWAGREREYYLACAAVVRANKERLSAIADATPLRTAASYDRAVRETLTESERIELDGGDAAEGTPIPPADTWYMFQVAHRNLWRLPDAETALRIAPDVVVAANPSATAIDRFHAGVGRLWMADALGKRHYLDAADHAFLERFRTTVHASNGWLDEAATDDDDDPRARLASVLARGLIREI